MSWVAALAVAEAVDDDEVVAPLMLELHAWSSPPPPTTAAPAPTPRSRLRRLTPGADNAGPVGRSPGTEREAVLSDCAVWSLIRIAVWIPWRSDREATPRHLPSMSVPYSTVELSRRTKRAYARPSTKPRRAGRGCAERRQGCRPENREPTARPQIAAGILIPRGEEDVRCNRSPSRSRRRRGTAYEVTSGGPAALVETLSSPCPVPCVRSRTPGIRALCERACI